MILTLEPFNQFLMHSFFDKKEQFQVWWDEISNSEEYTEFCLPLGSFDRQGLRYLILIISQLCAYNVKNEEPGIAQFLESLATRLSGAR